MGCCRGKKTIAGLRQKGLRHEARQVERILTGQKEARAYKPPSGLPKECAKYYSECRDKYKGEEYCSRVAWSICCKNRPSDPSCGPAAKRPGPDGKKSAKKPKK